MKKNNSYVMGIFSLIFMLHADNAFAVNEGGSGVGNGGDLISCSGIIRVLDEVDQSSVLPGELSIPGQNLDDKVQYLINNASVVDKKLAASLKKTMILILKDYKKYLSTRVEQQSKTLFTPGNLLNLPDEGVSYVPRECNPQLFQAALQVSEKTPSTGNSYEDDYEDEYTIKLDYEYQEKTAQIETAFTFQIDFFESLTDSQKAIFIQHEALWVFFKENNFALNSVNIRKMNRYLFTNRFLDDGNSVAKYNDFIKNLLKLNKYLPASDIDHQLKFDGYIIHTSGDFRTIDKAGKQIAINITSIEKDSDASETAPKGGLSKILKRFRYLEKLRPFGISSYYSFQLVLTSDKNEIISLFIKFLDDNHYLDVDTGLLVNMPVNCKTEKHHPYRPDPKDPMKSLSSYPVTYKKCKVLPGDFSNIKMAARTVIFNINDPNNMQVAYDEDKYTRKGLFSYSRQTYEREFTVE